MEEEIPLTRRPYKEPWQVEESCSHFDPEAITIFEQAKGRYIDSAEVMQLKGKEYQFFRSFQNRFFQLTEELGSVSRYDNVIFGPPVRRDWTVSSLLSDVHTHHFNCI